MGLRDYLERKQRALGLSDPAMAERTGLGLSLYWKLKNGRRQPGATTIRRLLAAFPEDRAAILDAAFPPTSGTHADAA